jgi:putative nucleotidyltransferase with HDIG domain
MLSVNENHSTPGEIKRVLFVDDDEFVLDALKDALRPYRHRWLMTFATSGKEALAVLDREAHDVVVSDLRMPEMDGARLLEAIRDRHPGVVRIVLSGHAEMGMVARAAAAAHRLVAKPCEADDLALVIHRSCALQELAARVELDHRTLGASDLPSVPRLYAELTELLANGTGSAADAARVVESDMAMTAKVLHLANSAFFGRRSPVSRLSDAVAYLGLDALRALVLQAEAANAFRIDSQIPGFDLDALQQHCGRVARLAAVLAAETEVGNAVFTAGLLHDVGMLVIASQDPGGLAATLATARERRQPVYEIELEQHGVTHADVGAHLLALWGIPPVITEAVAGHHDKHWLKLPFDGSAVIYVANALIEELEVKHLPDGLPASELDLDYLDRAALAGRLVDWRDLAARQFFEGAAG